jgi:cytochrome c-type biogenesis protein CcmE
MGAMSPRVQRRWWAIPLVAIFLIGAAVVALVLLRGEAPMIYRPF